ncbi:MAG: hypothetical protein ACRD88_00545 [Terriglobia bacterium]
MQMLLGGTAIVFTGFLVFEFAGLHIQLTVLAAAGLAILGLYELTNRRAQVVIDERGVSGQRVPVDVVPWSLFRGAFVKPLGRLEHVWLEWVRPGSIEPERLPIRANSLEVTPQRLVELITERAGVSRRQTPTGT